MHLSQQFLTACVRLWENLHVVVQGSWEQSDAGLQLIGCWQEGIFSSLLTPAAKSLL